MVYLNINAGSQMSMPVELIVFQLKMFVTLTIYANVWISESESSVTDQSFLLSMQHHSLQPVSTPVIHFKRQHLYKGLVVTKPVFGVLRTTKAQTDQRLCYSLIGKYHI